MITEAWLAGFWEADGSVWVHTKPSKDSPFGFYPQVYWRVTQTIDKEDAIFAIEEYLKSKDFKTNIKRSKGHDNKKDVIEVNIGNFSDAKKIMEIIYPYCVSNARKRQLELTIKIAQMCIEKKHLFKEGFLEMIDLMHEASTWKTNQSHPVYTKEFFEKYWAEHGIEQKRKKGIVSPSEWGNIRRMHEEGLGLRLIGEKYGVTPQCIDYILKNKKNF